MSRSRLHYEKGSFRPGRNFKPYVHIHRLPRIRPPQLTQKAYLIIHMKGASTVASKKPVTLPKLNLPPLLEPEQE